MHGGSMDDRCDPEEAETTWLYKQSMKNLEPKKATPKIHAHVSAKDYVQGCITLDSFVRLKTTPYI
jgi:hypothetical protein